MRTAPTKSFEADRFTDEYGNKKEGLQEAIKGKQYWLLSKAEMPTTVTYTADELCIENDIIKRTFNIPPKGGTDFYTKALDNKYIQQSLLCGTAPEAIIAFYSGEYAKFYKGDTILAEPKYFFVGGTQKGDTFILDNYKVYDNCEKPFDWSPNPAFGTQNSTIWQPKGKKIEFNFIAHPSFEISFTNIKVKIIYEMYDKCASIKKRIEITNTDASPMIVARLTSEILDISPHNKDLISIETAYECGDDGTIPFNTSRPCNCKKGAASPMTAYANCLHTCYEVGPAYRLDSGKTFASYNIYEFIYSTYWFASRARERLAMYRIMFVWITDNPLIFHSTKKLTKKIIDHAAKAGFEIVIQSFAARDYSKQMLTTQQKHLDHYKNLASYAKSKGIDLGIYQAQYLLDQYKISPDYGKNGLGKWGTWCLASAAFDDYYNKFVHFLQYTGIKCVEIDGPYPNCLCDSGESHIQLKQSGFAQHYGYFDSQVKQWENGVRLLLKTLRNMNIYINVPAWYYLSGGNNCGIGYEEIAYSQPRQEQLLYGRQIINNASYARTMSMSWTHIPFSVYHGGGGKARFTPFKNNLRDYDWVISQTICNGIGGVFRGNKLYDKKSLPIMQKWTTFYKQNRSIINADLVPLMPARCSGDRLRATDIDTLYHASPEAVGHKGLLWVYNQTNENKKGSIKVPLYYTGLTNLDYPPVPQHGSMGKDVHHYGLYPPNYSWLPTDMPAYTVKPELGISGYAEVTSASGETVSLPIDNGGYIELPFDIPSMQYTYFFIG